MYIHIYVYIYNLRSGWDDTSGLRFLTVNLRTKILAFRGFDSSRILIVRGGFLMSIGNSHEIVSQAILAGIILVGRLGVAVVSLSRPTLQVTVRFPVIGISITLGSCKVKRVSTHRSNGLLFEHISKC